MKLILILGSVLFFTACVHRSPEALKSSHEEPHAVSANISAPSSALSLPASPTRRLSFAGKVYCGEGISQVGLSGALVEVTDGKKTLGSTETSSSGNFMLAVETSLEGRLVLRSKGKCGKASRNVASPKTDKVNFFDLILK